MRTLALITVLASSSLLAQTPEVKKPVPLSVAARFAAAKTIFIKHAGGSRIPFDVIVDGVHGWGRYTRVSDAGAADLVAEISSPGDGSGVSVSSSTKPPASGGRQEESTTTTKELSSAPIKIVVFDGKSRAALWSATEQPKFALKQKNRKDNIVEAAQRLLSKFRERAEPIPAGEAPAQ